MSLSAEPCCCCATLFVLGARSACCEVARSPLMSPLWLTGTCACACFLFLVRSFACILSTGTLLLVSGGPVYISSLLASCTSLPTRSRKARAKDPQHHKIRGGQNKRIPSPIPPGATSWRPVWVWVWGRRPRAILAQRSGSSGEGEGARARAKTPLAAILSS